MAKNKKEIRKRQQKNKAQKAQKRKQAAPEPTEKLPDNYEEQVKKLTAIGMSIVHDEANQIEVTKLPQAYQSAQQTAQSPEDAAPLAVADVTLWVLESIEQSLEARQKQVAPIVVLGSIGRLVAEVSEVMVAAGIAQMTPEDTQVGISVAINKYIPIAKQKGKLTDQQVQQAAKVLQEKYPEEAQQFNQMIKERGQRHMQQQEPAGLLTPGGQNG